MTALFIKLQETAKASYEAANPSDWESKLLGSTRGSAMIGSIFIARDVVETMLKFDTSIAEGDETDEPGVLTKTGLRKLSNGLAMAQAGLYQHVNLKDRYLKPSRKLVWSGANSAVEIGQSLAAVFNSRVPPDYPKINVKEINDCMAGRVGGREAADPPEMQL